MRPLIAMTQPAISVLVRPLVVACGIAIAANSAAAQQATQPSGPTPPGFQNLPGNEPVRTPPPVIPTRAGEGVPSEVMGQAYNSEYPLSDAQIREYRRLLEGAKRASAATPTVRPIPENTRVPLTLSPGRPPHVLRLSSDLVSTVVFTDSTGAPWPIVAVVPGAKGLLDIKVDPKRAPHMFTVAPLESYASTNISVWLENSTVPVIISVVGQQRYVDFMLELAIQARGPNAKAPTVDYAVANEVISAEQNEILNGLTPQGATELKVTGGDARAWMLGNRMILRTAMLLRAPTARRVFSGADGSKVYELPSTPVVNLANEGRTVTLSIAGFPAPYMAPSNGGAAAVR